MHETITALLSPRGASLLLAYLLHCGVTSLRPQQDHILTLSVNRSFAVVSHVFDDDARCMGVGVCNYLLEELRRWDHVDAPVVSLRLVQRCRREKIVVMTLL